MLNMDDQVWRVKGDPSSCDVCTSSKEYKFFVYPIMLDKLWVQLPFIDFKKEVFWWLRVAPFQFHPNYWAFVRDFEVVVKLFDRPRSLNLFFMMFEVVRQVEKVNDGVTRYKWVSLRKKMGFEFFDGYSWSFKKFKDDFLYVVPVNRAAMDKVVSYDVVGKIDSAQFHFDWSYDHFRVKTNTYSRKEAQLGVSDQRALKILCLWASRYISGSRLINTKVIVWASTQAELKAVLFGIILFFHR